jgi:hypothetical protein
MNDRIHTFEAVQASRNHLAEFLIEAVDKWKQQNDFTCLEQNTIVTSILGKLTMEYFFQRTGQRSRVDAWESYKGILQETFEERMKIYENY